MPGETAEGVGPDARIEHAAQPAVHVAALTWRSPRCGPAGSCVEIANLPEGGAAIRDGKLADSPVLAFTQSEWDAFVAGVRAGEFD